MLVIGRNRRLRRLSRTLRSLRKRSVRRIEFASRDRRTLVCFLALEARRRWQGFGMFLEGDDDEDDDDDVIIVRKSGPNPEKHRKLTENQQKINPKSTKSGPESNQNGVRGVSADQKNQVRHQLPKNFQKSVNKNNSTLGFDPKKPPFWEPKMTPKPQKWSSDGIFFRRASGRGFLSLFDQK